MRLELMNNLRSGIDYQIYSHEVAPVHIRDSGLLTNCNDSNAIIYRDNFSSLCIQISYYCHSRANWMSNEEISYAGED
jgi:hypothetical protein